MAGNAPVEAKVDRVLSSEGWKSGPNKTHEVLFENDTTVWKVHQIAEKQHPTPVAGESLRGWFNEDKGTFGIAADRAQGGSSNGGSSAAPTQGRDDAVGRSIERQVAAYCTARIVAANMGGKLPGLGANDGQEFASYVEYLVDTFANAIAGKPEQTQIPTPEPGGAATATGDDDIPF